MVTAVSFFATALLGCAAGRLLVPSPGNIKSLLATREASQRPLGSSETAPISFTSRKGSSYKAGNYTRIEQDGSTCTSYGERQWTGTVDVSDDRRLFYWFAESRNDPAKDPVILWMNGGPGGSSLIGLFTEMGPCVLEVNATEPVPNPWAWNNNASVVFLDQPAGTGFSSVAERGQAPSSDEDSAIDFQNFLNIFFRDVFPEKGKLPLYIAGESYAGHFTSTYTKHILDARALNSKDAFWGDIAGLINVNAVLDWTAVGIGAYELLCSDYRGRDFLESEECDHIRLSLPELARLGQECRQSTTKYGCLGLQLFWVENIDGIYRKRINSGERNNYDVNIPCVGENGFCEDMRHGNFSRYLNQDHIKKAIGVPESMNFQILDTAVGEAYAIAMSQSRARTLESVLDAPAGSGLDGIRLLVLNGNEDYIVNTPGQKWQYDNLFWGGYADYRISKWSDLPEDVNATGFWKGTEDGRLVFVGVDGAGHGVPSYLPEASYRILQRWIANEWR
ncbi:hypothetical protein LMH87_001676 [Akanthomyces muscarius]|uniref:Carboxypeptidase n=1 Tax=Akanthomyces muscarius TaxID=2231603 RepID=A0A9W8UIN3_AKAMU|nr:hypothetical protein LMH87_001676 [Akanthomyces muscarius]KAJ4147129.1 hypothetical protein LMH87_001676 [Akanthomyces muscarius]